MNLGFWNRDFVHALHERPLKEPKGQIAQPDFALVLGKEKAEDRGQNARQFLHERPKNLPPGSSMAPFI
jgi:hypothetical protein